MVKKQIICSAQFNTIDADGRFDVIKKLKSTFLFSLKYKYI